MSVGQGAASVLLDHQCGMPASLYQLEFLSVEFVLTTA